MIDERVDKIVDWLAENAPAFFKPWGTRLKRCFIGFRPALYWDSAKAIAEELKDQISTVDMRGGLIYRLVEGDGKKGQTGSFLQRVRLRMQRMDAAFEGKGFSFLLVMTVLAGCLVAAAGTRELAAMAAFLCLCWLSCAMETEYAPVTGGVRQSYLAAQLLEAGAYAALLAAYFAAYVYTGLTTNIVLQSMMALTTVTHLIFYLVNVAFNRKQSLYARLMAGVLGVLPALTAAAGIALSMAYVAASPLMALAGVCRTLGVLLSFISRQLTMITQLGGVRLRYERLWPGLMMTIGYFMMLLGAWVAAM